MKLTQQQQLEVLKKINDLLGTFRCPVCGSTSWVVEETILKLTEFGAYFAVSSNRIYPVLVMSCTKCGNTLMFNAVKLGLVNKQDMKDTEEAPK